MYWKLDDTEIHAPAMPLHVIGTEYDRSFVLVTESGEDLTDAYLFVGNPDYAGYLYGKPSSDSTYKPIMGPLLASCFLGDISADSETSIDLRVAFPASASDGLHGITVYVGHDDGAERPNPFFGDGLHDLWHDGLGDLWHDGLME